MVIDYDRIVLLVMYTVLKTSYFYDYYDIIPPIHNIY